VAAHIQHPRARVLHGTLRTVHAMALAGCRWQSQHAAVVDTALSESATLMTTHAHIAWRMVAGAEWIAHRIHTRTTTAADVAGAEVYAAPPDNADPPPEKMPPLAPPVRPGNKAGGRLLDSRTHDGFPAVSADGEYSS